MDTDKQIDLEPLYKKLAIDLDQFIISTLENLEHEILVEEYGDDWDTCLVLGDRQV